MINYAALQRSVWLFSLCFMLSACGDLGKDALVFKSDDNKIEMGAYKSTIFLSDDPEVKRVGARGYLKMDGKTDILYLGFTCGETGGQYTQLTVDREDPDGYVSFDGNSWDAKDGWVMYRLASSVCKFAIKN